MQYLIVDALLVFISEGCWTSSLVSQLQRSLFLKQRSLVHRNRVSQMWKSLLERIGILSLRWGQFPSCVKILIFYFFEPAVKFHYYPIFLLDLCSQLSILKTIGLKQFLNFGADILRHFGRNRHFQLLHLLFILCNLPLIHVQHSIHLNQLALLLMNLTSISLLCILISFISNIVLSFFSISFSNLSISRLQRLISLVRSLLEKVVHAFSIRW